MFRVEMLFDCKAADVQGVKECLACQLEHFGDVAVINVEEMEDGADTRRRRKDWILESRCARLRWRLTHGQRADRRQRKKEMERMFGQLDLFMGGTENGV